MSNDSKGMKFPDVSAKLSALPKKSLFERQKAEAEAKRAREKEETDAVYQDFVKSFEDEAPVVPRSLDGMNTYGRGGPPRRHFAASSLRHSGPGTLGPSPSSLSHKRTHTTFPPSRHDHFQFANMLTSSEGDRAVEEERAVAKPTLHLASLPPGTSVSVIKALISPTLSVDSVKILGPPEQTATERKTSSALVTLASDSAASQIDATVSALQKKYLGFGHYLSISRHLSSAVLHSHIPLPSTASLPFGAKPTLPKSGASLSRAPPPGQHPGGFAPPGSYGPNVGRTGPTNQIEVTLPSDIRELRHIHNTIERILKEGLEFETLLMNRSEIQQDEKWSWLFDARSPGGVYYRWKLWQVMTDPKRRIMNKPAMILEDGLNWIPPKKDALFEYVTRMDEFVEHPDYDSSDEENSDGEPDNADNDGPNYMTPLKKAKLTWLLARLPTTHAKLQRKQVARITHFAITHAGTGANEVVDVIIRNVLHPVVYSAAIPHLGLEDNIADLESSAKDNPASRESLDTSPAKLVGLYVISDILSSASTSGVPKAWRYRQLFENALRSRKVFEHLGRLDKDFKWGRLKSEKWKRTVGFLLDLWEGWCCFTHSGQVHFKQVFEKPPLTEEELQKQKETEKANAERAAVAFARSKNRWKTVDADKRDGKITSDIDGVPMENGTCEDCDGVSIGDNTLEDISGAPYGHDNPNDADHAPIEACDLDLSVGKSMNETLSLGNDDTQTQQPQSSDKPKQSAGQETETRRHKPRPKAEDMFASDSE
jgi:U2-associated protein SR140